MSATKLRGRARQETIVAASESIGPTISHDDGSASGVSHTRNACKQDSRTPAKRWRSFALGAGALAWVLHAQLQGRKRRSIPVLLRIRLAISSIEHSVVS